VFIMFPDPWHKARHNKRRLIQPEFVAKLARVMKPGASLRFATDWADYGEWTTERVLADPNFRFAERNGRPQCDPRPTTSPRATRKRSWATAPRCSWTSSGLIF
jgi:tRNA (guanine-N7-)-methyltransferase